MASGGAEEDDGGIPLDIDNVHMVLQVEHEQIQKRTFTNWINAQLAKRCPPSFVSDLFSDLRDGSQLLDLLEVMSGLSMKRQRGRGVFQQRANIETALNFLKKKSIKLVNINIPDIIDGRPSIILGLIWTIILHCHIEELASALSFSSRHSSLDSLSSLDSWSGSPVPASPVPSGRTSPLHRRFRISAKKALLMWVRDQCQKVHCSVSVRDFKSSWRSGEAFLAILCSLRPQLVDLSLVPSRSNQENLEEAFQLAERELHIPRLLEPQDVDVKDPEEKSIMTYVAQFLQYSNDMPAPDDHLHLFPLVQTSFLSPVNLHPHITPAIAMSPLRQVSPSERAQEVTSWLQQAYEELSEAWTAAEKSSYAEKYQVFQSLAGSFTEQRRPVMTLFSAIRRCPGLNQHQHILKTAWDRLEEELQRCKTDLDVSLPPPLDSVVVWLQRAEAELKEEKGKVKDDADAAKEARAQQDTLKTLNKDMSHYINILDTYHNMDDSGDAIVPPEKFDEIKKRLTNIRVTAKYQGIKLEYQESRHTVLDLLRHVSAKVQSWKAPYRSQETIHDLLQDWHETVEHQGLLLILSDALQNLKERAYAYTSKAALGEGSQLVARQVKEAESEADLVTRAVVTARGTMDRVVSAWETYNKCLTALQAWLAQNTHLQAQSSSASTQDMTEWTSCQAQLNEAGNFLTEVTETSTSFTLAEQLSKVNMQWAECIKKAMFEVSSEPSVGASCLQMVHSLTQEAGCLLGQPLEVASAPLKASREKLQLLSKKMIGVDVSSLSASQDFQASHIEKLQQTLPQMLAEAEKTCGELQRAASKLEGHLAELDHWSTDALDCYNHIKEKMHRGHSALASTTKVLISRGLQLVNQVVTEDQDLQDFVAGLQKTSPLQHLSTSRMQHRISEAVSRCQEILGVFSSLGFKQQVGEFPNNQSPFKTACQTPKQPKTGFLVVARTKQGDQTENVVLQTQDPNQLSPRIPSHTPQQRTRGLQGWSKTLHMRAQDEKDIVTPHIVIQMMPQPLKEPTPHSFIHSHLAQAAEQGEFELLIQPQSFSNSHPQASSFSENDQSLSVTNQTPDGPQFQVSSVWSKCAASSVVEEKESSSPSQTHSSKHKSSIPGQPNTSQSNKPPVMVRSEVHSKAQSMARSRLEKARSRLQGRIQQAIKLFGGKEFSESQVKKKQKALKMLQPSMLEEFLGAVEGYGAFCSGLQLQDLMLLSDSVRKQWEDVRREMAAFVPILWSKIREGKPTFSVVQYGMHTNSFREATDQTDRDFLQHQAVTEGDASVEEGVESLRELCETLTPRKSLSLATDQLIESDEVQETQPSDTALPADGRGRQLGANTPLRPTDMSDDTQSSNNPPQQQSVESQQQELVTAVSAQLHGDGEILQLQVQDDPAEAQHHPSQSTGCVGKKNQKPSLKAEEQLLKARLLHITESSQQTQSHIQALVRSNTVEKKQKAEFTVIPETVPPQQEQLPEQGVLERMSSLENTAALMESADDQKTLITEKLNQIIRKSVDISPLTLADPTMISDLREIDDRLQAEIRKLSEQSIEEERQGPEATSLSPICQALHCSVHHLKQLRQQLGKVQSAAEALDRFLATVREVKAEIPTLLANQDPNRQKNEANWEQGRHSWQAAMQRLQAAAEQSDSVDGSLNAVGMTLTMDGTNVTCQDVVKSVSKHVVEMEKRLVMASKKQREEELFFLEKVKILEHEELNPVESCLMKIGNNFPQQSRTQEHSTPSGTEKELALEPKRSRLEGENYTKTQREEAQTMKPDNVLRIKEQRPRRRSSQITKEGEEKQDLVQRRAVLLAALRETKTAAEQLRLQEPSLPALQQRTRALTELESSLAGLLSEVQYIQDATSQSGILDEDQIREMEDLWEETTKAVTERLEQCCVLTELLKKFQSLHGELSGTLQKAENTISNQASYMGKDNLQRLHTKVQEIKVELNGLGDSIEEIRSICRQLHTRLHQIPDCNSIPFESEADALMDRWLDLSERTDSYLENLHLGLALWDGVLQLGTEVESWTNNTLAAFAQCPSFQTEDDIESLKNEIATQEESIQRFHRRAIEIQSLLQSTEPPLELQVVETQVRKKIEQLKELVSEAEDVYRQMVTTKGQITGRMEECLTSLQMIQESLLTLSGPSVATVLAKLKELCWQLHTQDEQAESLQEDVRVITAIAGPECLLSLSINETQLQEKVRNTHQLFSKVEEQTEKNIQDLDRLQTETDHLEQWLHAAEEKTAKEEDLSHLQEEALQQSMRTELLSQLVSSLQSSNLHQLALLEVSGKLMERYHNFHTHILGDLKETQFSLSKDIEAFQGLAKFTRSWVEDLRQIVDSALVKSPGSLSPIEQRLYCAQVVLNATTEGETRLEELRVTGDSLNCKLLTRDDLKQGIQETIQKTEEQWKNLLQSVEPHYSVLQADPQLTSIYLARRQEASLRVEELHHQTDQLPILFPWPGTAERTQTCLLAHQLWEEAESLQLTLTSLSEQRRELAERTSNSIWKDLSWNELDTRWSALMAELKGVSSRLEEGVSNEQHFGQLLQDCHHKLTSLQERMSVCQAKKESSAGLNTDAPSLEVLLQEVTDIEKDILQLATLKDAIIVSSTGEAQAGLSQQVSNLQNHKRVLENGIRENLGLLNRDQRIQQVKEEASCLQTALKDLTENVGDLCGTLEVLPDTIHLKQQWCAIKDLDTMLTELDARVNKLQRTRDSSMMQEMLPAEIISTITALFKDLGSLTSIFQQKKKECAENAANKMTEVISQLHQWSQRIRAKPALLSQAALDEGLQLQQALYEVLSEQHFLLDCLGAKVSKELEKSASSVFNESQTTVETLSKCLVSHSGSDVQIENVELLSRSKSKTPQSSSADETSVMGPSSATDTKENSESCQNDNKINTNGTFHTSEISHPSTEPVTDLSEGLNVEADASKQDKAYIPMQKVGISVMGASRLTEKDDDAFVPIQVPCSKISDVLPSKAQQESQHLTLTPQSLKPNLGSKADKGISYTDTNPQSSKHKTLSRDNTEMLMLDLLPTLSKTLTTQEANTQPLEADTALPKPESNSVSTTENMSEHLAAQPEATTDARCQDIAVTTKKVFTIVLDVEPMDMQRSENAGASSIDTLRCSPEAELCDAVLTELTNTGFPDKKPEPFTTPVSPESDVSSFHLAVQSETFKTVTNAQQQEKHCEDVCWSPDKIFTIVLDVEPQPWDMQQSESVGASSPDVLRCSQRVELCDAQLTEVSNEGLPEKKSGLTPTLIIPVSDETDFKSHCLSSESDSLVLVNAELEEETSARPKLPREEHHIMCELEHNEVLTSFISSNTVTECQLTHADATETTFPDVKQQKAADFCHSGKQTVGSVLFSVEDSVQIGDERVTVADTALNTGTSNEEIAEGENTEEANDTEYIESKHSKVKERRDIATLSEEESEWKLPAALEDMGATQGQPQSQESMEPERTALCLSAGLAAAETSGGSTKSSKHRSTMQDILSEIQSLVERSNIINRTPHIDLNWYLKSSLGEPEIKLVRTVQQILACRYQPAQLSVTAMTKQLGEAEEYRRCVQQQVATMKNMSATVVCDPNALKKAEGQWSAALLDASATVQVKAAQLDQVKQYHRQMTITRAFLEVLAAEKEKMSLNALGSSALQAEKLHVLLQTMERKKGMMEDLFRSSGQLSVHLSDAESSGALLAQLGDVQEEWRLLEGSIKRALRHASNATCQSSLLLKEAEQLKDKFESLQLSTWESLESKSALELVCLTTDLKLYYQLYRHLQSQSDALINFSLGQKEKDEIEHCLQGLGTLLSVTKTKLDSFTNSRGGNYSCKINKQLQDLIVWAKQADNHISVGEKLALFPEEARIQIVEMKKFQTDILSRRSKMQVQVEEIKDVASDMEKEESDQVLRTVEDLYQAITDSLDHVLDTMKKNLNDREKLLCELASMDAWLAETYAKRDPCTHVENVSKADIKKLESELKSHKLTTVEIETQLKLLEGMSESCKKIAIGLSPGESHYLVNRLSGLWTELDGLLAHEKATSWELEELIHERTSSDEELSTIQASLKQISDDLDQEKFPLTQDTLSVVTNLKHMLMEHQCQVQELQHCQETKRSPLLCSIGELQDRCKALSRNAFEQEKYLHLRKQMEESRDIVKGQIQHSQNKAVSVGERFRQCQALLVGLPLIKTQCQEAADQLEVIAQELQPSELSSERERIHHTVETLVSWENSVTDDIKNLETKLLLGLKFNSELPALIEQLQTIRLILEGAKPVIPEEKAIDIVLQQYWVIWRNMESGMRVLEGLGRKEKMNLKNYKNLYFLRDTVMRECHSWMVSLSQARESLKDYQWAAQGAIGFLHNAEATFLSAPGGFLDCTEEQRQTQQALETLEDGFQAHICHLVERVPQQPCLSRPEMEQLHISIVSQLLVGRAVLEAQAQLRLETLQRCEIRQQSHKKCHEDIRQHLSGFEARLSECAAEQVGSYDKCVAQQRNVKLLMEDIHCLAGKIEDLRAACPMHGCGVGKDGELGALWRRWVSSRRGVGLLMAHTEQRGEEWKDITTSMEQCCSFLTSLQAEVPDSSTVSFTQDEPQELLAQAEVYQAGLEQEQQALAFLEHQLEHALSLSTSQDFISPGPIGKTLVKIQENVRSLKERNLLVVAAAQAEEKERQQVQEEIGEVEKHMLAILLALEACSTPNKRQELREDLSTQKTKLKCIMDSVQSRYAEIPADIGRLIQEVQLTLQRAEQKLMEKNSPVAKLANRVIQLGSGLEKVKELLEQRNPTVSEARNVLKHVWDELDTWHSSLMLLENEVQDLAEELPDQAQLLTDQLTQPLQIYQNASQMAEHRTAFLSKIPACLQEFEDILSSATCWLGEAQLWLSTPCLFTTARSLQNHAKSLQLVLEDSERISHTLQDFRPVLAEVSTVCDMSSQEERLTQTDRQVQKMQCNVLEPLEQLLQAVAMVEEMEAELKTIEKNISKIKTILSSVDISNITLMEHLQNREVILANVRSMQRTLEEIEKCKGELHIPQEAEESLLVFSRARLLLQPLEELEQLTQQQASLLENKIREEEGKSKDPGFTIAAEVMQELGRSPHRRLVQQEAFEVSYSEEEEDEEDESCHSSSSDTLTCSIPEDLEETLNLSDVQSEDMAEIKLLSDVKEVEHLAEQFSSEMEMSSESAEARLLSMKPGVDTNFGSKNAENVLIELDSAGKTFSPITVTTESLNTATIPAAEDQFVTAATDQHHESPKHETLHTVPQTKCPQAAAALEDTRLIPSRPITPFTSKRASDEFLEEEVEDLCLSTAPHPDLDTSNSLKSEVSSSHRRLVEGSQQPQEFSEMPISLAECKEDDKESERWNQLHSQISKKLITLTKVKEEHQSLISADDGGNSEKVPERELISTGSSSAVLQRTHESITMLRQIVCVVESEVSATGRSTGVKKELHEAVRRVLFCLDSLTDLLLTPGGSGEDDSQLKLLQQECVSAELETLVELLSEVKSETGPALSKDEPDAYSCLTCLQDCLHTVQLVFTFPHNQLTEHPAIKNQHQELFSIQPCLLDVVELGQSEIFPRLNDAPSLECVLGRHLRESPGEKAKLQHASRSLLQGIARLLELGEECITERQMSQVHNYSKLQTVLCRHKKLLQVLRSQLAYVQHLFQHEPEALKCQEDERVQLEVRAKALQQQALEQEVASQRRLLEWTRWEGNCAGLGRVLDECEAFISSGAPEGDDDEEKLQHRLDACQQTLVRLDESRAALGRLLDDEMVLQAEPLFAASVGQAGGALELRCRSVSRRTEQEIQRCRDIQDTQTRFQTDFALLSERLLGANKPLKTLSDLADASDLSQECVHSNLTKLLDFSIQVEAMSVLKESVSKDGTRLLHLREADCPGLRTQLTQLEVSWNRLTSDQSKIQEQLQQRLLAAQPPVELLSDLEDRLKNMEAQLKQEKEGVLKATNAAQITEVLWHYQVLQAAVANGQLLLDFLCQPAPQTVGADIQALRSERTVFSEKLGTFRLKWQHFQRELENQIRGTEQIHHNCAGRERHLQRLHGWIERQKIQVNLWKQPTSQTLAHKALLEWEAVVGRVREVASAVQELQTRRVHGEKGEEHPSDTTFSTKAESTSHACRDLSQQMEALRPVLQRAVDDWSCFHRNLQDAILHTTRLRCALHHQQAPLFSLKQAEGYSDLLQLQGEAGKGEELWTAVDKSCQNLVQTLHPGAAQALHDQVEGERKRWNDIVQEIKDEYIKTEETRSLWQEYTRLSDNCSVHLQNLWHQWEKLSNSSLSPEQNTQDTYYSVKKLQEAAEDLQGSVGEVLAVSKPLTGQLEPLPANLIQSETRLLSRDILLLNQAMSGKKKSLQEDLDQQKLFHTQLEAIEKQTRNLLNKSKDTDSVQQVLLELSNLYPSVAEIREMGSCMTLAKQETERLHMLSGDWVESMTSVSDMNRKLQAERQHSQSFQEKCKNLTSIQEKLKQESVCRKPPSYSSVQEMLAVHQRLQAEITAGHQFLQGLLCDAVRSMEKERGEKRSELMAHVACMKESWFNSIALARQNQTLTKEQLHHWRIYHCGLKLLRKLLTDVDSLLPPTGPSLCTLQQLQNCANNYQCAEQSLGLHSPVYTQTLEAGKHLCETMTEPESQNRLQSELLAIEEAWERSSSLVRRRRDLVHNTVQMWSECQDGITNIMSELDELKLKLPLSEGLEDSEEEVLIQETELSLQRLAGGLKELVTMKTDLSQYVVASDSALLEQQLEQLHSQWEELCMKVSLHRQEIADRLNAWTIFNDKNREFCDWLTQMENKVCHSGDLSIEEMVEKLKKDCMEEINLFSENKSHLKQLGEQLLLASDEAKQSQVHGSLQEVNQRWHNLFHHIEARVKKLKETLVTVQQLDKNMSNLRSWLSRIEAELSRPITYSVCHEQEIQRRLAEQQELQRDIEQHTEGVASVLSLCDVLLRDEDAAGGTEAESDSLQETSRSLDQRWRTICAMALDRRLRIEETWTLWCKFLNDYSRFDDWLKMAERTAANPNSADVLFTVAKEELKKFEGFQRQVHEWLTQLELVNNQYRRLARENRTDRASQLKAMVHEGNRRWDTLHRRVAAILRRLKYFTSQREEFEGTRESMLVWLTELDLQLTNVEHFSESDVHHKIQQLNSFQKEITLNTERIDGLIVFGEGLIQRSSPQDAALIEDELEELHSYCQEVFSRLVRFHQRLSHPPQSREEPELSATTFSLESSLELIGRPWLGRNLGSLPATPTHLLTSPLERSGRETPASVDSLPLEWDHTGDVGGSSSHEDDEEEEADDEEGPYFSALSVCSRSMAVHEPPRWRPPADTETQLDTEGNLETPTLTSTPLKHNYLRLMSQCSGSIENIKRVSLILDDEEQPEEFGLTGLTVSDKQSGVIERWELLQAQSRCNQQVGSQEPQTPTSDLDDITSWLENVILELKHLKHSDPAASIEDMEARAKELKEMQKMFAHYKSIMLSVNLWTEEAPELQNRLMSMNRDWSRVCTGLQQWDSSLRKTLMRCQEFHETLHSLLLWLAHAESRRYAVDISHPDITARALQQHSSTLTDLREELRGRQAQQASLQALWSQLQPEDGAEESDEAQEKLHVTGSKLKLLLRQVDQDLSTLQQRLDCESASAVEAQNASSDTFQESVHSKKSSSSQREMRDSARPRSFFYRVLRAAFPLQLLLLLLLLLPCLIPVSESDPSCTVANNFARSFYPMLHYTNGPPPT
ncbi:nesprin-2 isoform X5 [Amphiprion ocellaris]|uniref:nesprin-2 isoform X5 n=1 Tax=Amphiprion ocellaris TaxID=80972 RepID=UPI0024110E71|nr:nesprin-2 isoform X5 [Amphiprion ocellaris]